MLLKKDWSNVYAKKTQPGSLPPTCTLSRLPVGSYSSSIRACRKKLLLSDKLLLHFTIILLVHIISRTGTGTRKKGYYCIRHSLLKEVKISKEIFTIILNGLKGRCFVASSVKLNPENSQEIIDEYAGLNELVQNGHIYIEIRRGMYAGLAQVGILANQLHTDNLASKGHCQCCHAPGLWRHKWCPIMFSLLASGGRFWS